jgi:hypothetical protein
VQSISRLTPWRVFLIAAALVATGGRAESAGASGEITLVFRDPNGRLLPEEKVRVYLLPYDPAPEDYVLIAAGRADDRGRFTFSLSSNPGVTEEARRGNGAVNVHVAATDDAHRWLAVRYLVLEVGKSHRETIRATFEIPDDWTPTDRDLLGLSYVTPPGASDAGGKKPRRRWVRVMRQHVARGMVGHFYYLEGRGTDTQVALEWTNGKVEVGGWRREAKARTDGYSRRISWPFNRLWQVEYVYRARFICKNYNPECTQGYWLWYPDVWTWGTRSRIKVRRDPMKRKNRLLLKRGEDRWRHSGKNVTFGAGARLLGLSLGANANYSTITKLSWRWSPGCRRRWLYGKHLPPGRAKVVQARSRGCR